jgi:DNA-binding transcriptional MerR regulator
MYRIGTVARLAQVSVRTLRHYDEIGLLTPAEVDPDTGYRRYSPEQVQRLHRILVLRDLGIPLGEIAAVVDDDVTVEELRGILRLRQADVRAQLAAQTELLARVEARLAQMEGAHVADYEVIVKGVDRQRVVALREDIAGVDEIAAAAGRMYPRLHDALVRHGVAFGGVSLALYDESGDDARPMRLTTALPVPADVDIDDGALTTLELPAVERAATTVVVGSPERFHAAFEALHAWTGMTGEREVGSEREVYVDCDGPRDSWVTELQVLLESRLGTNTGSSPTLAT